MEFGDETKERGFGMWKESTSIWIEPFLFIGESVPMGAMEKLSYGLVNSVALSRELKM